MKYFNNVNTLEELRKQYKELLKNCKANLPSKSLIFTKDNNI